jgi:hypothetical protein
MKTILPLYGFSADTVALVALFGFVLGFACCAIIGRLGTQTSIKVREIREPTVWGFEDVTQAEYTADCPSPLNNTVFRRKGQLKILK